MKAKQLKTNQFIIKKKKKKNKATTNNSYNNVNATHAATKKWKPNGNI
jgi:hypothetical protein